MSLVRPGIKTPMNPHTLTRTTHPETSRLAAEEVVGSVALQVFVAVRCVMKSPGSTARELDKEYCPNGERQIGKRLDGAARDGLIKRGESRRCKVSGRLAQTWWPVGVVLKQREMFA